MPTKPSLRAFFKTVVDVQKSERLAHVLQQEVSHHIANAASVLISQIRQADPDAADRFYTTSTDIMHNASEEAQAVMRPVVEEAIRLHIGGVHLVSMYRHPEIVSRENHKALRSFQRKLKPVHENLIRIREEGELALLRSAGIVPPDFKLSL